MTNPRENLHGTVISFNDITKLIPKRGKFLDTDMKKKVKKIINKSKDLLFMPNSTWEKNMQSSQYEKSKYKLVVFGVLEDGSRSCIIINNIEPYFEVKIPDSEKSPESFAQKLHEGLFMQGESDFNRFITKLNIGRKYPEFGFKIEPTKYEVVQGKPLHEFQEHNSNYVQIYFNKLEHRKDAINYVRAQGYETCHDDIGSYYRVVSRDHFLALGSWLNLSNYTVQTENNYIKGSVIQVNIEDITNYKGELDKHLLRDNLMTCAFDIETYNQNNDGEIPMPEDPNHNVFMISLTYQWHYSSEQLLSVCLVDVPSAPNPDFLTIVCETEENLIRAFGQIFNKLQPELIMGFNSDSYDWHWIITRAQKYKGLLAEIVDLFDFTITKDLTDEKALYNYRSFSVKIEATTNAEGKNLQTIGYIPFDVMICFRKLYPTSEQYSLNFFLSKNKLSGKEDMPYMEMFKIYSDTRALVDAGKPVTQELLEKMSLVGKYCVVDSARCHDLTSIRNVLQDRRAVANISYTSVYDAFYRADGMKVRNLVINRGQLRNLKISNIGNDIVAEGKYPGAWVFEPTKGLVVSKLSIVERIEKAKQGYTEYSEWLDVTPEEISEFKTIIEKTGPDVVPDIPIKSCFKQMLSERMGRPITGLDYSSLYPSLMMTYNLSPEYMITNLAQAKAINKLTNPDGSKKHNLHKIKFDFNNEVVRGWSVRHDNHLDPTKPEFKFGIFPTILKELFDARKRLKSGPKGLNYWEHEKEKLLALPIEEFELPETKELYEDVCFNYNALDSKQRALKVYMNTFYGESGNKRSPLYMIQVAGGITSAGRDNIKRAYEYVKDQDCQVYYGDSVTPDTPILIRYTTGPLAGNIDIRTIDNIPGAAVDEEKWIEYPQFKPSEGAPIRVNKQQHLPELGLETWTAKGWAPIKRVIRHRTNKKIFRINTHIGCVDVTEDHSLLKSTMESLSPKDAKIGDELFHSFPSEFLSEPKFMPNSITNLKHCNKCNSDKPIYEFYVGKHCKECELNKKILAGQPTQMKIYFSETEYLLNADKDITAKEAWIWGAFHADGSCNKYILKSGINYSWSIVKKDIDYLNKLFNYLKIIESNFEFKIFQLKSGVYRLVPLGRVKQIVEKYRKLFYDKRSYKIVPMCILNAPINIRKSYWDGFYAGDGAKTGGIAFCQRGKINIQSIYYLMTSVGYTNLSIFNYESKLDIYRIHQTKKNQTNEIKKIMELSNKDISESLENLNINTNQNEFVYDIETEAGTFLAGVGKMIITNTDSLYLACPEKHFGEIDIDYYTEKISKLAYWEKMVEITFEHIQIINSEVNQMLRDNNGTDFLKMSFEESLFPCAFLAKKKYFGIPHLSKPNFNENVPLFIRGLELKKRGVSQILIDVCQGILNQAVSHKNILTIIEIVQNTIVDFYNTDWTPPDKFKAFIMSGVYKPNKQNVKMHTFQKRMADERGIEIAPGERIKYVIVKKYPYKFDMRGRKTALSIGDTMELADKAEEECIPVNIDYYMEKTINGQLARFITYHDDFQVPIINMDDPEELKKAEDTNLKLARKFVDDFCKKYYTNYANKGGIYKTIFKKSTQIVKDKLIEACGSDKSSNVIIKLLGFSIDPEDNLEDWIFNKIKSEVEKKKKNKAYGVEYLEELLSKESLKRNNMKKAEYILMLQDTYYANKMDNISKIAEANYHERQQILEIRFRQSLNLIKNMYHTNNNIIEMVSSRIKSAIDIDSMYNNSIMDTDQVVPEKDLDVYLESSGIDINTFDKSLESIAEDNIQNKSLMDGIIELKFIYYNLLCNYEYIYQIRSIVEQLKTLRDKKINSVKKMSATDKKIMLDKMIRDSVNESIDFN
jgi:DNA polymerase elongation subunit (family B)